MEAASKVIRKIRLAGVTVTDEQLACAAWPRSVGKTIAAHTRAARMVRQRLIVEVEDQVWQLQLNALRGQILRSLEKGLGSGVVGDLEFRIVPRRMEAGRALASTPALAAQDEAERIEDPVLRSIYRASRKRALA
ncbi:MAG TPA: DUF721 domain-containing protein [Bryobacteraceae bacterium]|nr:DUF721 domain-containing protein [Bryobacteraceae bacterium]